MTYVDYFTLGRSLLLAVAIAALVLDFWQTRRGRAFFHLERFLVVLAILSVWAYTGFGRFHGGGHEHFHAGEMYHYYLSSKYFTELGYDGLYGATLSARPDDPNGCLKDVRQVRDLRTAEIVPAAPVRTDPSYRERFSAERWSAFRVDLAFLLSRCHPKNWQHYLSDHGYNAPPWRTIFTAPIANALGAANRSSLLLITFLDYILLAAAIFVVHRTYGLRTAALATVLLGCSTLASFDWIGGSFLRQDWLVLCIFGACALETRRPALAGAMLGAASLLRIFPALFAVGFLAQGGLAFLRTRSWDRARIRFSVGLGASLFAMLVPSLVFLGGAEAWQAFYAKISLHLGPVAYGNHVGLRALVGDAPFVERVAQVAIVGVYIASLSRLTPVQTVIFGGVLVYGFGFIASYYYGFLALYLLWDSRPATDPWSLLRSGLVLAVPIVAGIFILLSPQPLAQYDPRVYAAASLALLVFFAVLTLEIWRRPDVAGGRSPRDGPVVPSRPSGFDAAGGPAAWPSALGAFCGVVSVLGFELILWHFVGGAEDRMPVVAASLAIAVLLGAATSILSRVVRAPLAIVVALVPVFAISAANVLDGIGLVGTAGWVVALLLAALAAAAVAVLTAFRVGRIVLVAAAALMLLGIGAIGLGDRVPVKPPPSRPLPDIVFLVMDTTRRDHLPVYGYPEDTMPRVTEFAGRAQVYEDAWSVAPWTTPSHASMLSGQLPAEHDADGEDAAPLPQGVVTLAAVLGESGYRTAGFAANPNLHAPGWRRDFDVYRPPWWRGRHSAIPYLNRAFRDSRHVGRVDTTTRTVFADAKRWWSANGDGPRFLFLNVIDPHTPYRAPQADRARFLRGRDCERATEIVNDTRYQYADTKISRGEAACLAALYDAELYSMDREIGAFLDWLEQRGERDEALIAITSDHGERLGERGHVGHLLEMDQHLLRVPLLIRYPPVLAPERIERRVLLTGLPGFILDLVGIRGPETMRERSFTRSRSEVAVAQHRNFAWFMDRIRRTDPTFSSAPYRGDWVFVAGDRYAFLWAPEQGPEAGLLFEYERDRHLERDLADALPAEVERLRELAEALPRFPDERGSRAEERIDASTREQLRILGYIE